MDPTSTELIKYPARFLPGIVLELERLGFQQCDTTQHMEQQYIYFVWIGER